jgi:hypothetical protein
MKHLVIGLGEVGRAIQEIFECPGVDKGQAIEGTVDIIHVCIPYSDEFVDTVRLFQQSYLPKYTVIHSTVPVGTSRECNAIHSPIRGIHPHLYEGVMTFPKFLGGTDASEVADEFRKHGLKVILCDSQETTELGKLLDTEYYRSCIEFTLRAKKLCDEKGVPFHEAYTLFNLTYNEGYTELGHPEYVRPTLQPIMRPIGGHCVMPNAKLIEL